MENSESRTTLNGVGNSRMTIVNSASSPELRSTKWKEVYSQKVKSGACLSSLSI
jgi:hypothetical protein